MHGADNEQEPEQGLTPSPCPTLPVSARLVPFLRQDQPTLQALLDSTLSSGFIYEEDWKDMVRGGGGGAVPTIKLKSLLNNEI